jgi:hypothetical protein
MKYKSIISAISFLLISMFYVASAAAQINGTSAHLYVALPHGCGAYERMSNKHCPLLDSRSIGYPKGHDTIVFKCKGGGDDRSVTSIMTQYCGRFTMTTFATWDGPWVKHFADVSYGSHKSRRSENYDYTKGKGLSAKFYITLKNTTNKGTRSKHLNNWCKNHAGSGC